MSNDIEKKITELSEIIKNKDILVKEVNELKGQKSQLEHDIDLLKKIRIEHQKDVNTEKIALESDILVLQNRIKALKGEQDTVSNSARLEISRLDNLKSQVSASQGDLNKRAKFLEESAIAMNKNAREIESKKLIILQIKELAEKL